MPRFRTLSLCLASALALTACKTNPQQPGSTGGGGDYVQSCVKGALAGAAIGAAVEIFQGRRSGQKTGDILRNNAGDLGKAAAAGCVIGLAVTAVGQLLDARQQARHEEAMQAEAQRRAQEQQRQAATMQRAQAMPGATPAQREARDSSVARARAEYEASLSRPVTVDLGNGASSTIRAEPAAVPAVAATPAVCQDFSVFVNTPSGRARQFETWCPNAQGRMVRTEVRSATA